MPTDTFAAPTLIGRDYPVHELRTQLHRTRASHGGLVLVGGEAGIGKTTLVTSVAREADQDGLLVVNGAAWQGEGVPGYWPWMQVVRHLQRVATADEWRQASEAAGDDLDHLFGEGAAETDPAQLSDAVTFRLYDAVTTLLVTASRQRPVVVVLDDLHWADAATVKLLDFLVRHTWFERLLVLGTYRDVEVDQHDHPLQPLIATMLPRAANLILSGLDADGVRQLLARTGGEEPDDEAVAEVHRRTGGNPFLVEQAGRLHASGARLDAGSPGVREALRTRLALLPSEVRGVLVAASVLGTVFSGRLLAAVSGTDESELDHLIEQAVAARLVNHAEPGRYAFVHDLVREALYVSIDPAEVRKRHAAVVSALHDLPVDRDHHGAGSFAHHAYRAVPEISLAQARTYQLDAAREACAGLRADDVALFFRRALELVPDDDPALWAAIAEDLASAQRGAGELPAARGTLRRLVRLGRTTRRPDVLARAALGLHELGRPDDDGPEELDLLDEAWAALTDQRPPEHDPLAVRLLAAAARTRVHSRGAADAAALAEEQSARAVALARQSGNDEALRISLLARHDALWQPGTAAARIELADELVRSGRRGGDPEVALQGALLRITALVELGDPAGLDEHASFTIRADDHRLPRWRYTALTRRAAVNMLTGRFAAARDEADAATAYGECLGEVDRQTVWREQRWLLAVLIGDYPEAHRHAAAFADVDVHHSRMMAVATSAWAQEPLEPAEAAAVAESAATYPRLDAPLALPVRALAAAATGDRRLCHQAREALTPLRDLWATAGAVVMVLGPYAYWLALVDAAEQRWDEAAAGFTAARQAADRLRARPWSVLAGWQLARTLHESGRDPAHAAAVLADVSADAAALGMAQARDAAAATLPAPPTEPVTGSTVPAAGESPGSEFRFDGRVWNLTFAGRTVHLPDAKGLRDLHTLLRLPGGEVPASDLLNPAGGEVVRSVGRLGADAVLDEQAKAQYRRRLAELDEQIDRAVQRHQDDRAAELDRERAALIEELRSATGLAGRARRLGDEGERARKTVTARIRDTMRRLDTHHPELAEHLRASISTGVTCRYQPTREVAWQL
jgi:hypothetical protein